MTEHLGVEKRGPLAGLAVVELGEGVAAPFCAKVLADLGADVVKVEPPGRGDRSRWSGPFPDDARHPEKSGLFLYLNTGKRSVTLDPATVAGRSALDRLLQRVDVLIEDRGPHRLDPLGLGPAALAAAYPRLVVTSITPFGASGPWRDLHARHLNLYHVGGQSLFWSSPTGEDRPPPRGCGHLGEVDGGLTAAVATLAAVRGRRVTGRGRHVDVSIQEAMLCLERVDVGAAANDADRRARPRMVGGLVRARDGFVVFTAVQEHQWRGLVRAMGSPEWASTEWCRDEEARSEHRDRIQPLIEEWVAGLDRDEIYRRCQAEGAPVGPIRRVDEVLAWEQARARDFFRAVAFPDAGVREVPESPYRFSVTPATVRPAPRLGEHNHEILYGELGLGADEVEALSSAAPEPARARVVMGGAPTPESSDAPPDRGPLDGVRVVDFTWAWAGPHGTLLLAMLGAEVIKVESATRLDHSRVRSLMAGSVGVGPDASPLFNHLNLGKRSLTLNLRTEEAREVVRRLVAVSDVVVQNMRPGVLDRLGLGYERLRGVKPDLIMLSSSAVGATGPESSYSGYAPTFASLSGAADLTGYPDDWPVPLSGSVDLRVGTASALAVLAALRHRDATGEGQDIDLSSTEVMSWMVGEAFLELALTGRVPGRMGNRHPRMAPHGCYRCRGERSWVTIAVDSEQEWDAVRGVLAIAELDHPDFADLDSRRRHQDRLDALIERWTREREPAAAAAALQAAGVAALPLLDAPALVSDPHLLARGIFSEVEHPVIGPGRVVGPPWRFDGARAPAGAPAPLLGQHNDYVLAEVLGLGPEEIEHLAAAGALT